MSSPTSATTGRPSCFGSPHADVAPLAIVPAAITSTPISRGRGTPARGRGSRARGAASSPTGAGRGAAVLDMPPTTNRRALPWNDKHVNALTGAFKRVTMDIAGPGSGQHLTTLWGDIFVEFRTEIHDDPLKPDGRTQAALSQKWGEISKEVSRWVQAWKSANSIDKSGFNEDMVMEAAKGLFLDTHGHYFKFFWSWSALKDLPKYRSHRELPKHPEPHFEAKEGDPLGDGMTRPTGGKTSKRLKAELAAKVAEYKMIEESNKVLAELGRERVAQAYQFQEEMVLKRGREVLTRKEDIRREDEKREWEVMTMPMTDLLPHQKAYVRERQDVINEKRRKLQEEKDSFTESVSTQEEDMDVPIVGLTDDA